jgi:hypothetical protein
LTLEGKRKISLQLYNTIRYKKSYRAISITRLYISVIHL